MTGMREIRLDGGSYRLSRATAIGPRNENQDSMGWFARSGGICRGSVPDLDSGPGGDDILMAVVCDGMGGLPHGRQASEYTVDRLIRSVSRAGFSDMADLHRFCMATLSDVEAALRMLYPGCGTTVVIAAMLGGEAAAFHLGDSRAYHRADGRWGRTFDHAPVDEMFRNGLITEDEVNGYPGKNVISKFVGDGYAFELEMTPFSRADRIVLCSDGAYACMGPAEFEGLIDGTSDAGDIVRGCMEHGIRDNTTVICISRCG